MSNFGTSTQLKNWVFKSTEELTKIRERKFKRVYAKLKESVEEWNKKEHEKSQKGHTPNYVKFDGTNIGKLQMLTLGDEIKYVNALTFTIIKICEHMKLNNDVLNTSIEYLKRFFLKQSVYDFDGLDMMYACIYLAVKVEEVNYRLSEFVRVGKGCTAEKIVQCETFLIKGLRFQFFVYSPYR